MSTRNRGWIIFLIGAGLTLIAAGLSPLLMAAAQDESPVTTPASTAAAAATETSSAAAPSGAEATPEATAEGTPVYQIGTPVTVTGDNSYCLICHNQAWHSVTLQDGTIQNLYVNPATIAGSVHGTSNPDGAFGCVDCHGRNVFPHDQPSPTDGRTFTLNSVQICASCHQQEARDLESGLHEQAIRAGDRQAAVCTDCHGSHNVQRVVEEPELIAGVCGTCHTSTLAEWRASPHVNIGPLGCATCHAPHTQRLRAGNTPEQLCQNCHNSVDNTLVHQQHLNTTANVVCTDCHMYTGSPSPQDTNAVPISTIPTITGHSMQLETRACTSCHENLVANGTWAQLIAAQNLAVETQQEATPAPTPEATPELTVAQAENNASQALAASQQTGYVQLIQGLVLGLGFGVTFAAVFIARGNRSTIVVQTVPAEPTPPQAPEPEPAAPEAPVSPENPPDSEDGEGESQEQGGT